MFVILPWGTTQQLLVTTSGDNGDADLFVKFGESPSNDDYDCRRQWRGSDEICTIETPRAGTWFIGIRPWKSYNRLTLKATW